MAATLGEAHFFEESMNTSKVRSYLASSKESEKSKGMKFLLANMSKGRDMSEFFPDVVKNVVVRAVEVKKMVYMYLVHYADATVACRELALLSINSFQKDLAAANQLIRALALRVMTSIRVPDIIQIQVLAVLKCASDSSPYVRRCAATAVSKIYAMDASQLTSMIQVLEKLLKDSSTMVLGAAVAAFNEVCPNNWDLLHRSYRKLCHLLADLDEWTQIVVLNVLTRYMRTQFTDPAPGVRAAVIARAQQRSSAVSAGPVKIKRRVIRKAFYSDEEDMSEEEEVEVIASTAAESSTNQSPMYRGPDADLQSADLDPDHRLVLRSSLPLLKSRNCGVVLAVCTLHYYCGTQTDTSAAQLGKSLVRISRNRREIQYVVLKAISSMAQERPQMFRPSLPDFFVKSTDPSFCRILKLNILTALTDKDNVVQVLRELQAYVKHSDKDFICATVQAVGRVADALPDVADKCLHGLMTLVACTRAEKVLGEVLIVIRQLLQQNQDKMDPNVVKQLANLLVTEREVKVPPMARASLIWVVGEFHKTLAPVAPDILRTLAHTFPDDPPEVKIQVINLAVKLYLHHDDSLDDTLAKLVRYVLEMARFDTNYDIRDRTRLLTSTLGLASAQTGQQVDAAALVALRAKAEEVFLKPKLPPVTLLGPVAMEGLPNLTISSLSWMLNHKISGYQELPDWVMSPPDPSVRDAPTKLQTETSGGEQGGGAREEEGSETASSGFYSEEERGSEASGSVSGSESEGGSQSGSSYSGSYSDEEEGGSPPRTRHRSASASVSGSESEYSESDYSDSESESSESGAPSRRSGYDELGQAGTRTGLNGGAGGTTSGGGGGGSGSVSLLGLTPPRRPDSPEGALLDLEAYATAKKTASPGLLSGMMGPTPSGPVRRGSSSTGGELAELIQDFEGVNLQKGLGGGGLAPGGAGPTGAMGTSNVFSIPRELLRHEMGGGLKVEYCYTREDRETFRLTSVCSMLLTLTNMREGSIRHIKITASDTRYPVQTFGEIPAIETGTSIQVPFAIDFKDDSSANVKLLVVTDRGSYNVQVTPPTEELIRPNLISSAEAEAIQRSLGGFHESRATFSLGGLDVSQVPDKLSQAANIAQITSTSDFLKSGRAHFSGIMKKKSQSERVIVKAEMDRTKTTCTLQVNCDDAMLSVALLDILKKTATSNHPIRKTRD